MIWETPISSHFPGVKTYSVCSSFFSITNVFDAGVCAIGDAQNIGMVCKAETGSRSLYVYGITQNTADYNEGDIVLRLGFIKD